MKKLLVASLLCAGILPALAQNNPSGAATQTIDPKVWYHADFATTSVLGINTQGAYNFFASKGLKPNKVLVSVIDSGVEIDHPGLKPNIWTNIKEIAGNNKDDDHNGYIDDVHGWNFIGGKNGDVDKDNLEVTRVYRKYRDVFESQNRTLSEDNRRKMPTEYSKYLQSKQEVTKAKEDAAKELRNFERLYKLLPTMKSMVGTGAVSAEKISAFVPKNQEEAISKSILTQFISSSDFVGKTGTEIYNSLEKELKEPYDHYAAQVNAHYNVDFDPRNIVGDNYNDINEKYYGNNHYEGPDALHGTHVAGIIAGVPSSGNPQYGVAYKVAEIMTVRAVPDGDERDKDIANAIRYSVDNGAKVINMSFGKGYSSNPEAVWDAIKYAEKHNVLLVHAAGNDNKNLGQSSNYPTNYSTLTATTPLVKNMITIGASKNDNMDPKASFSNFNPIMVDVFAPGEEIYSTVTDGKYMMLQGTSMASPVVAGAAALLLAYMPNLTPEQIIQSLKASTNISKDNDDYFKKYSVAKGVIDVKKAAEIAYQNYYSKGNSKTTSYPKRSKSAKKTTQK